MKTIQLKRVYENFDTADGFRILVDRLWPRGINKENDHIDLWLKEIAPSTELRTWFNHEVEKWDEFQQRYVAELNANELVLQELLEAIQQHEKITLLYGAKDTKHNQAVVLKDWLSQYLK
ncbi:MAG: DUF488 domain-containing protein [Bacteroidia bacterium]|nr:MAG: DUF488 domain-containing protein [Bacteroidia bacterium]